MAETGRQPPEIPTVAQDWKTRAPTVALKVGWLRPDDIAPAAVFLASDAATMVTGAEYQATGGDSAKNVQRPTCLTPSPPPAWPISQPIAA